MNAANHIQLMGRLTADPELKATSSGKHICRFTVAVDRGRKNANGEREADFISCIAWEKTAELISRYWSKGKMIAVGGELRTGSYKDRRYPDITHYTTDVIVEAVAFCGDKSSSEGNYSAASTFPARSSGAELPDLSDFEECICDSDLPF